MLDNLFLTSINLPNGQACIELWFMSRQMSYNIKRKNVPLWNNRVTRQLTWSKWYTRTQLYRGKDSTKGVSISVTGEVYASSHSVVSNMLYCADNNTYIVVEIKLIWSKIYIEIWKTKLNKYYGPLLPNTAFRSKQQHPIYWAWHIDN